MGGFDSTKMPLWSLSPPSTSISGRQMKPLVFGSDQLLVAGEEGFILVPGSELSLLQISEATTKEQVDDALVVHEGTQ